MKERAEFTAKCIKVMEAFILGKTIECSNCGEDDWSQMPYPSWDWCNFQYRVKPEPMEIEVWVSDTGAVTSDVYSCHVTEKWTKKKFREVL